jgi:protein SCO1/2
MWMLSLISLSWFLSLTLHAQAAPDPIDFQQKIGSAVPQDLEFRDEMGQKIRLGSLVNQGTPVILSLAYFHCKTLCPVVLNGVVKATNDFAPDQVPPFQFVVVSIDPRDNPEEAKDYKAMLLGRSLDVLRAENVHLLTGTQRTINSLAESVGFRYRFDARTGQYQHPSGLTILTGHGRISRYFFGIEYPPDELRRALSSASQDGLGRVIRQIVLACYRYNAETGTYTLAIYRIMRILAVLLLAFGGFMLYRWEHRRLQPK